MPSDRLRTSLALELSSGSLFVIAAKAVVGVAVHRGGKPHEDSQLIQQFVTKEQMS
ncbi:MAG TPA: hypothetical protein VEO53_08545 [Candidatus Binatia bacterium]|nr:hypothetical protein [Candidatus Binatia bacterium]